MLPRTERCSDASEDRDESMVGTASTVRSWLVLEHQGPWGHDALLDARLPEGFGVKLLRECLVTGVRPLLIRRLDTASAGDGVTCFAIRSGPEPPWIETTTLDRIEDALAFDLRALGRGERLGLQPHGGPLFLVCTHGRHDVCCAERGRPVASALSRAYPNQTWESSHVGGDRFAANVVAFPHGLYLGRVRPTEAAAVATTYAGGRIPLEHLRGRSCHPMPVQAAEHALRTREGLDRVDDVRLERHDQDDAEVVARFRAPAGLFEVRVHVGAAGAHYLTCRSLAEEPAPTHEVVAIERVDDV